MKRICLGALLGLVAITCTADMPADGDHGGTITVTGSASVNVEPDRVMIRFGVETQSQTSSEALAGSAELMDDVIAALRRLDVGERDISTSRFTIQPVYESQVDRPGGSRTQKLVAYRVSNILAVESDQLDAVGAIIDATVGAGVNRVDSVQFFLSDPEMKALKDSLVQGAVRDAERRAMLALDPVGHTITGVREMVLSDFAGPMPIQLDFQRMEVARSAPTQVFASDQEVQTTVNVTFRIGPVGEG
ncbi:MAG: SIMPL domain-containing protein [Xanthomonadales bacterium]|nr:SIMPL domain-containing protein [Xanthomonadales bacterium]